VVQGELKPVALDTVNPFFKSEYASYQACRVEAQPHLAKAGLAVFHVPCLLPDGKPALECFLSHKSGQWMSGIYPLIPVKNDPQSLGSATTYAKRYSFKAMVGIFDKEDDDGNAASQGQPPKGRQSTPPPKAPAGPTKPTPPPAEPRKPGAPTEKQLARMFAIAHNIGWTQAGVKVYCQEKFNVTSSKNLSREQYDDVCEYMLKNPAEKFGDDDREEMDPRQYGDEGGEHG
jgi:hypothetical protein